MKARLKTELDLVRSAFPNVDVSPTRDSLLIPDWDLPHGWNRSTTNLLVLVPKGYPATPPDNFYTDVDL